MMLSVLISLCSAVPAQTVMDGVFFEDGGLVVIEMESIERFPDDWRNASTTTAPNLDFTNGPASGDDFLTWQGGQFFSQPGVSELVYPIDIANPGTYRFQWRAQIGNGTDTTLHNDTWLKIDSDAFFGEKPDGRIVCPRGLDPAANDCEGEDPEGASSDGWFKVYTPGARSWSWRTLTSDNDGFDTYARFDAPGRYAIRITARSSFHIIDRLVMNSDLFTGNPQNLSLPESERVRGINPPVVNSDAYAVLPEIETTITALDGVLANDDDPNGDELNALLESPPSSGNLDLFSDGSFTFQPPRRFEGELAFQYRVTDGMFTSDPVDVSIEVTGPIGVSLVNVDDNVLVQRLLSDNQLSLFDLGFTTFSAEAVVYPVDTESIRFQLTGPRTQDKNDNFLPFTLFGFNNDTHNGRGLSPGSYTMTMTAYDEDNASGNLLASRTITFSVVNRSLESVFADGFEP
ncbi:MAG: Ig-like domain-containing protein [Pseudomonadota bacterium]